MITAYQFRLCDAPLAICNPAVTTRNLLFLSHLLRTKIIDILVCFSAYLKPMVSLQKHNSKQKHHLPPTSSSPLSRIFPKHYLNYLCIKLAVPICKPLSIFIQVYNSPKLFMVPFLPQCRDLGSEVLPYHFKT